MLANSARHASRSAFSSGRSCSAARSDFFFSRDPESLQRPVHRRGAARDTTGPRQLLQGSVGGGRDRLAQPLGGLPRECRGLASPARLRRDRAGLPPPLEQAADPGLADREPLSDLSAGVAALIAGSDDPLPQVPRIRGHPPYLLAQKIIELAATFKREPL
jgi:hypothetical protein